MEQITENKNKKFEAVLFLRKEPDFRDNMSAKFIEDGNFPYGFDKMQDIVTGTFSHEDGVMNKAYEYGQNGLGESNVFGEVRSVSVGDVFRVNSKDSERFFMVAGIGFDEFNPITGKFM